MKTQLDKKLIEGLKESKNQEFLENVNQKVFNLISNAVNEISKKSPFVKPEKCILQPVNETFTGAFCQLSNYSYFLGIDNPQLETNSVKPKNFLKYIWREFRAYWRIGRKKYKKIKGNPVLSIDKYQLKDFKLDVLKMSAEFLSETTLLTEFPRYISLIGKDDFGTNVQINIYVCCYDFESGVFKLPYQNKNKFFNVDFGNRVANFQHKLDSCGEVFVDMLTIFNALFSRNYNKLPNQILLESLLFNVPDKLFDNADVYKSFLNVGNFIRINNPASFKSVCNEEVNIFKEPLITASSAQVDYSKIVSLFDNFKY